MASVAGRQPRNRHRAGSAASNRSGNRHAEGDRAVLHRKSRRARPVLNLGRDPDQRHHLLEVGQRLLDVAVHHAEEIERRVELQQIGVDQHEIADGHRACRNIRGRPAA